MIFAKNKLGLIMAAAVIVTFAQAAFGHASSASAFQTGRSYFENVAGPQPYTGGSASGCVGALIGYVIPNYTTPDYSKPAGQECNGSGAIGDMRMMQVAGSLADRRESFFQVLKYDYNSGDAWEKAGASQVALSLLGYGFGATHSRTVSAAEWADLHTRITAPDIEMLWASDACGAAWCLPGVPFQFNTAGIIANGRYDSIRVNNGAGGNVDAWVFRSVKNPGLVYATFEIECGNGIGTTTALPGGFNLTPSVTVPVQDLSPGDATVTPINSQVLNTGPTNSFPNTYWQLIRFIIPSGVAPKGAGVSGSLPPPAPCVYYTGAPCAGNNRMLGQGNSTFGVTTTLLPAVTDNITGLVSGQQVCYALSVKGYDAAHDPSNAATDGYRYGAPVCREVAKSPKLQIWGGDLRTRGNITTSASTMGGAQFGSWVEYAAFSTGSNTSGYNFASGSGFAGGTNTSTAGHNLLTFANTAGSYGKYALPAMPGVAAQFTASTAVVSPAQPAIGASSLSLSGYGSGTYKLTSNNVTLNASDLRGTSIVLIAPAGGKVTIAGDINYRSPSGSDTFTDPSQLPQLIIIAKTIDISGSVKNVNAWLLATGAGNSVNTCSDVAVTADLNDTICANQLAINGPVMTDTLYLRRTAGSDGLATADAPAETFNLRADTYLWASAMTTGSGRVQTDQLTEAAARF